MIAEMMIVLALVMGQAEQFVIQSHRGAGELAPENTIEAFELAWKLGTVPEADLRETADGAIVAFHDENFARVVKDADETLRTKGVKDLTLEEVKKLDVGSWKGPEFAGQRVCAIGEPFARMKGDPSRRMYLDFKYVDLEKLAAEVSRHGVERQVILASTKYEVLRQWKKLLPESQTLLWMGGSDEKLRTRIEDLKKRGFAGVTQVQIHIHVIKGEGDEVPFAESDELLREVGKELKGRGILYQALPMKVADPKVFRKLLELGVESFATDHPQITLDAVKAYQAEKLGRK